MENKRDLKYLCLDYNYLETAAMPFLKKIIIDHPSLTLIDLNFNQISDAAIEKLLPENLEEEKRFHSVELVMTNNQITKAGLEKAKDKLSLSTLESMLAFNRIDRKEAAILRQKLTKLKSAPVVQEALMFLEKTYQPRVIVDEKKSMDVSSNTFSMVTRSKGISKK